MKLSAKKLTLTLIALVLTGMIVYAFLPKPVPVDLATVMRGPLRVTVDDDGKTRIKERYIVSAPLDGRLLRISLEEGDKVEAGKTVLAVIEPRAPELLDVRTTAQTEAQVKAAQAARERAVHNLEQSRVEHEYAGIQLERMKRLLERNAVSQQSVDDAEEKERSTREALKSAQFGVQVAEFELEQAKAALLRVRSSLSGAESSARFTVLSPIDGVVLRVLQESEANITAGTQLIELGNPADLEVEVDLLSSDAVRAKPGAKAFFEHWGGGEPLEGSVRVIEPAGFTKISALGVEEQRVNVILDLTDPIEKWSRLGDAYRVDVRIIVSEAENVLKVPAGVLFRQADNWSVYVVENGKAVLRFVKIGLQNDLEVEVLEGLKENDTVIVYPSDRIKNGVVVVRREEK
jgi:HlyD family secretion protein